DVRPGGRGPAAARQPGPSIARALRIRVAHAPPRPAARQRGIGAMKRGLSLYLDVVRVSAALAVVVTHLAYPELSGGMLAPWRLVGNDAVMVFFVLSGFVIAY